MSCVIRRSLLLIDSALARRLLQAPTVRSSCWISTAWSLMPFLFWTLASAILVQ